MPRKGYRVTEETKAKIAASNRRYWDENPWARDRQGARMREAWKKAKELNKSKQEPKP